MILLEWFIADVKKGPKYLGIEIVENIAILVRSLIL